MQLKGLLAKLLSTIEALKVQLDNLRYAHQQLQVELREDHPDLSDVTAERDEARGAWKPSTRRSTTSYSMNPACSANMGGYGLMMYGMGSVTVVVGVSGVMGMGSVPSVTGVIGGPGEPGMRSVMSTGTVVSSATGLGGTGLVGQAWVFSVVLLGQVQAVLLAQAQVV